MLRIGDIALTENFTEQVIAVVVLQTADDVAVFFKGKVSVFSKVDFWAVFQVP